MTTATRRRSLSRRSAERGIARGLCQIGWHRLSARRTYAPCAISIVTSSRSGPRHPRVAVPGRSGSWMRSAGTWAPTLGMADGWKATAYVVRSTVGFTMVPVLTSKCPTDRKTLQGIRISSWPSTDVDGAVLVWFDPVSLTPAVFHAVYEIGFDGGLARTWATLNGPVAGTIDTEATRLGLLWKRLGGVDEVISLLGVTPIDASTSDVRVSVWVPTERSGGAPLPGAIRDRWKANLHVWVDQTYIDRPPFLAVESEAMRAFRAWSDQWYQA